MGLWSEIINWSPIGLPAGDELIVIDGTAAENQMPRMDVDFTLTTGAIKIGPVNSKLLISEGVTFTNRGTVDAQGDLLLEGDTVNWGVYNNEAKIDVSDSGRFANHVAGPSSCTTT